MQSGSGKQALPAGALIVALIVILFSNLPVTAQDEGEGSLPLAAPGPYAVGWRDMTVVDASRNGREIPLTVWYPAQSAGAEAAADLSGAPYPLIIFTHGWGGNRTEMAYLTMHLASYGFSVAGLDHLHLDESPDGITTDRPLDVLVVLNALADWREGALAGVIDAEHSGVIGYSEGALTALQMGGARLNIPHWVAWCAEHSGEYPRICIPPAQRDALIAYRAQFDPPLREGQLWPSQHDPRIKAIFPITGAPSPLFGAEGLAAVTIPTLIMAATDDEMGPYNWAAAYLFENLGAQQRHLVTVVGWHHGFPVNDESPWQPVVQHLATAFFGRHLQGEGDYAAFLTDAAIDAQPGLIAGVYDREAGRLHPAGTLRLHREIYALAFSPDSRTLAVGSGTGYPNPGWLSVVDIESEAVTDIQSFRYVVRSVDFSPDGSLLAAGSADGTVGLWQTGTWEARLRLAAPPGVVPVTVTITDGGGQHEVVMDTGMVWSVTFSPDGQRLAVGRGDPWVGPGSLQLYGLPAGEMLAEGGPAEGEPAEGEPATLTVFDVAFNAGGTELTTLTGKGGLYVWESVARHDSFTLSDPQDFPSPCRWWATALAVSADRTRLAAAGRYGHWDILVWEMDSHTLRAALPADVPLHHHIVDLALSPDGHWVAAAVDSGAVWVWDVDAQERVSSLHTPAVTRVAFSPDGRLLAAGALDGKVRLWRLGERR